MTTVMNREQAFERAAYRAKQEGAPYAIYKHRAVSITDHIVKPALAPAPNAQWWDQVAIVDAKGKNIFNAE